MEHWISRIEFYKDEAREMTKIIIKCTSQPSVFLEQTGTGKVYEDKFNTAMSMLKDLLVKVNNQKQRSEYTALFPHIPIREMVIHQQDILRLEMESAERQLIDLKYQCATFLAAAGCAQRQAYLKINDLQNI